MDTKTPTTQELQNIRDFAAQWGKIVARRFFGDSGPPLDASCDALEQVAQAAAAGLLQGTFDTLLEQQAQALPTTQPCPHCQQPCTVQRQPRPLECTGATWNYQEPVAHCSACRRAFFPSTPHLASGRPPLHP